MAFRSVITDFSRGIVDDVPPDQIPENAVVDALNVVFDRRNNLRTRPGLRTINFNRNLIQSRAFDFSHADWVKSNVTVTANQFEDPRGTTQGDRLSDDSGVADAHATLTKAGTASNSEYWSFSAFFRVPRDVRNAPVEWAVNAMPALQITFSGVSTSGGRAFVLPAPGDYALTDDIPWTTAFWAEGASTPVVTHGVGQVVVIDDDWQWVQAYITVRNSAVGNTAVSPRVWPVAGFYTVATASGVTTVANGGASAALQGDFLGVWGAVLERGRATLLLPHTSSTDATIADHYHSDVREVYVVGQAGDNNSHIVGYSATGSRWLVYDESNCWFEELATSPDGDPRVATRWQNTLVAANKSIGGTLFQITPGNPPTVAQIAGSPTQTFQVVEWNSRLFTAKAVTSAGAGNPSRIDFCALGDETDWTDTDPASGAGFIDLQLSGDDYLTALVPFRGMLLVFTRQTIRVVVPGSPATDAGQMSVLTLNSGVGCVDLCAAVPVGDDVIFLSRAGWTLLSAVQQRGEHESTVVSRSVSALNEPIKFSDSSVFHTSWYYDPLAGRVMADMHGFGTSGGVALESAVYVLDVSGSGGDGGQYQGGVSGFTRLVLPYPTLRFAFGRTDQLSGLTDEALSRGALLLLPYTFSDSTDHSFFRVYLWGDGHFDETDDDGRDFDQSITTRAYAFGDSFARKKFQRWGVQIEPLSDDVEFDVEWEADIDSSKTSPTYTLEFARAGAGAFAQEQETRRFQATASFPTLARTMQATLSTDTSKDNSFVLKGLLVAAAEERGRDEERET